MNKLLLALLAAGFLGTAAADAPPPDGVRDLRFAKGKTSVTVKGAVLRGERAVWRFGAKEGQQATLTLTSLEKNAVMQVYAPGAKLPVTPDGDVEGTPLPGAAPGDDATEWSGPLPASGRFLVVVGGTRGNASYQLTLSITP